LLPPAEHSRSTGGQPGEGASDTPSGPLGAAVTGGGPGGTVAAVPSGPSPVEQGNSAATAARGGPNSGEASPAADRTATGTAATSTGNSNGAAADLGAARRASRARDADDRLGSGRGDRPTSNEVADGEATASKAPRSWEARLTRGPWGSLPDVAALPILAAAVVAALAAAAGLRKLLIAGDDTPEPGPRHAGRS
jgi:hypothetical protein